MTHAKRALLVLGAGIVLASVACSSMETLGAEDSNGPGPATSGKEDGGGVSATPEGPPYGPAASGLLLVHAAGFPSFRLCFQNYLDLPPQPDSTIMPEANVVGVEIGSLVRVAPLKAPGTVYVIQEKRIRQAVGQTGAVPCRTLIAAKGTSDYSDIESLDVDIDYHVANAIDRPLGEEQVSLLAISGCGNQPILNSLGLPSSSCGSDFDSVKGNLKAKVIDLKATSKKADDSTLPVQLFQMSQPLADFNANGATVAVTFGDLRSDAGALGQSVTTGKMFEGGGQTDLALNQTESAVYGAWGFRVTAMTSGTTFFTLDQSLAAVQELSSPRELPTTYYRAASNYALLLLGDPTHTSKLSDGGANPLYNPRQAVHMLAVPVIDPSQVDAGADAAASDDAGDGGG